MSLTQLIYDKFNHVDLTIDNSQLLAYTLLEKANCLADLTGLAIQAAYKGAYVDDAEHLTTNNERSIITFSFVGKATDAQCRQLKKVIRNLVEHSHGSIYRSRHDSLNIDYTLLIPNTYSKNAVNSSSLLLALDDIATLPLDDLIKIRRKLPRYKLNDIKIAALVDSLYQRVSERFLPIYQSAPAFFDQLTLVRLKAKQLRQEGHAKAAEKADDLYINLLAYYQTYYQSTRTTNPAIAKNIFKVRCTQMINEDARPELEQHRGWTQLLGNLSLAILGLGVGYAVAGLVNLAITGHFLFFRTQSAHQLDELENTVNQIVMVGG